MASGSDGLALCPRTRRWTAPARKRAQVEWSKFNSFPVERGIAFEDFFSGCALYQHVGDQVHWYSRPTIDRRAAHGLRVLDNEGRRALEFLQPFVEFSAHGLDLNHQGAAF